MNNNRKNHSIKIKILINPLKLDSNQPFTLYKIFLIKPKIFKRAISFVTMTIFISEFRLKLCQNILYLLFTLFWSIVKYQK